MWVWLKAYVLVGKWEKISLERCIMELSPRLEDLRSPPGVSAHAQRQVEEGLVPGVVASPAGLCGMSCRKGLAGQRKPGHLTCVQM